MAAVTLTPTASSDYSPSISWGYQPLENSAVAPEATAQVAPVIAGAWHATMAAPSSIVELFKKDPLAGVTTRSHVPELTTTALWATIGLAVFVVGQALRRVRRLA